MSVESVNTKIEQLLSVSRAIYIIDSAGILLHHEAFFDINEDPDLYAGLFSAVSLYANELKAGQINSIELDEYKFIFKKHVETGHLIILEVNKVVQEEDGKWLLEQILNRFDFMTHLLDEDHKGSLSLETLFSERGKAIDWNTIKSIREDAIIEQNLEYDKVETINLSRINMNNLFWVRIRKLIRSFVESQIGLTGIYFMVLNKGEVNILYSGRHGRDKLDELFNYLDDKFSNTSELILDQETEYIQINEDIYCAIFNIFLGDGGYVAIASIDKYLINKLESQIERMVAAIEKLAPTFGL